MKRFIKLLPSILMDILVLVHSHEVHTSGAGILHTLNNVTETLTSYFILVKYQ